MLTLLFFLLALALIGIGGFLSVSHDSENRELHFNIFKFAPFLLAGLVVLILSSAITSVDAGQVGVVKRFGKPVRTLDPGIHLVEPIAETVTGVITQTRVVKPSELAASHDLQMVHVEITFAYHIDPKHAVNILVGLNDDAEARVINPAILEAIKATTAQYDVSDLVAKRAEVRDKIEAFVKDRLIQYNVVAETTSITDFSFSKEFEDSIEQKVVAQQNAEKAQNDLQRIKIEADQQIAQAHGEAEALKAQKEQITPELLQLRTIEMMKERWDGHLPTTMVGGNGALPMMDVLKAGKNER